MLPAIEEVIDETIEEVIDDMFPPLRGLADDNEDFARKDPPEYQVEGVAAARPSYGSDTDNEFDEVDSDTKHSGNKVGGAMSTKMQARLILRRFMSKQASLTSPPSLFAKTTDKKGPTLVHLMKTTITSQKMIQLKDSMTMMNSFKMTRRKTLWTFYIIVQSSSLP